MPSNKGYPMRPLQTIAQPLRVLMVIGQLMMPKRSGMVRLPQTIGRFLHRRTA
jgi:hypothetical protein